MTSPVRTAYFSDDAARHSTHYHDCHELLFVTKGAAQVTVEHSVYTATAGCVAVFSRFENHAVQLLTPDYERYVLRLSPLGGDNRLYALLANRPHGFRHVVDARDAAPEMARLCDAIVKEFAVGGTLSDELLSLLTEELLLRIFRLMPLHTVTEAQYDVVFALQRRFENEPQLSYTLDGLAHEYGLSISSLSHRFKEVTGTSVMGYLLSCRLAAAKHWLTHSTLDVGEIVERCGFSDSSNFSRTFKRETGVSPSEFRRRFTA